MTTSWNGRRTGPGASSSTACPYHPGSISNEGVAVAFQLGRGEGLVDVFNGVGADHSSASFICGFPTSFSPFPHDPLLTYCMYFHAITGDLEGRYRRRKCNSPVGIATLIYLEISSFQRGFLLLTKRS